jgi:DNA end-binding protein Ku
MAARSTGSATISFGLVSIPIKLYTATSPQTVSFHMLHAACGTRLRQQLVCPLDHEVVERGQASRGYEYAKDRFVVFTDDELDKLAAERTDRIDLVEFVPASTVDLVYIERTHYLGPDKGGDRAYRLLSQSMERMGRIAVGRHGTRGKSVLVLVRPYHGGLAMHAVYYADEVRSFDDVPKPGRVELRKVEEELADRLVAELSVDAFRPEAYHDEVRERVLAAVEQKVAGAEVTVAPAAPQAEIIDLFEALSKSLGDKGAPEPPAEGEAAEAAPGPKKAAPRREAKKRAAG